METRTDSQIDVRTTNTTDCLPTQTAYQRRLDTFTNWSGSPTPEDLAEAGFIFDGVNDRVRCDECNLILSNWTTEIPWDEHIRRRSHCWFVKSSAGKPNLPKFPQYKDKQARLDSFVGWPSRYIPQVPEDLATAGFYYIGSADRVTCYQCGITLRDWGSQHIPAEEHKKNSLNCVFINQLDVENIVANTRNSQHGNISQGACNVVPDALQNGKAGPQVQKCTSDSTQHEEQQQNGDVCSSSTQTHKTDLGAKRIETTSTSSQAEKHTINHKHIAAENKELRDKRICKICRKEISCILFLPCGHLVTCSNCAPRRGNCISCGEPILGTTKTYFA